MTEFQFPVTLYLLCSFFICLSHARDALKPGEKFYNNETLISAGGVFELGFFAPSGLNKHYLGIWFSNDKTKKPIWVWHRDNPLTDSSGFLQLAHDGNLEMFGARHEPILVNQAFPPSSDHNTRAILDDSGNLILKQGELIIWLSFDHPIDTFLPGMRLGSFDMNTNLRMKYFSSWSNPSDPSRGQFFLGINPDNTSLFSLWHEHDHREIGFWDGKSFRFIFESSSDRHNFTFVSNQKEVYLTFNNKGNITSSWFVLASTGAIDEYMMTEQGIQIVHHSMCDGALAFDPKDCFIQVPSGCKHGDNFSEIRGSRPTSRIISGSKHLSLGDCEILCRSNCSCTAFSSLEDGGYGCELYYGDRKDLLNITGKGNIAIYVRGGGDLFFADDRKMRRLPWVILVAAISLVFMFSVGLYIFLPRTNSNSAGAHKYAEANRDDNRTGKIARTGNCCEKTFYKLRTGGRGIQTEVQLISKLQHVNLVKVLGCCIEQEEKILLDSFIFDPVKRRLIDWRQKMHIIKGIAQGLVYLHKYSRLRIIHRDLKTSNILLDSELNPKISDFGLARTLSRHESGTKTERVVGTYGYMSPEYGVHGLFTTKSDVYSFGVILLEIVNGRKNVSFHESDSSSTLLGYAWELWKAGRCIELKDPILSDPFSMEELMVSIQVGLLCIQDNAEDRPTMTQIVTILSNGAAILPTPKQPTFSTYFYPPSGVSHSRKLTPSLNYATFSAIQGR